MFLKASSQRLRSKLFDWLRAGFLLAVIAATGCARFSQREKLTAGEWPAPPPLPDATERKIEGLARYAAGLSLEMNNQSADATDAFYKAALADLDQEALVLEALRNIR